MTRNLKTSVKTEVSKDGHRIEQVAAIACVIDDGINENSEFEIEDDKELFPLYSVKQKESVNDVHCVPKKLDHQTHGANFVQS